MPYAVNKNKVINPECREPHPESLAFFCLLLDRGGEKEAGFAMKSPDSWLVSLIKLVFLVWTSFIDNPMAITEPPFRVHYY